MKYEIEKFYDDGFRGLVTVPVHKRAQNYINGRQEEGWHVFQLTTTPRPNGDVTVTVVMYMQELADQWFTNRTFTSRGTPPPSPEPSSES